MAHNHSTPQSVLDAPARTFTAIVVHEGATRRERRHGVASSMKPTDLRLYLSTANVPATSDRERKVRHGRKARWNR